MRVCGVRGAHADDPVPDWVNQNNRHAYYAAISYVDEHIGMPADQKHP